MKPQHNKETVTRVSTDLWTRSTDDLEDFTTSIPHGDTVAKVADTGVHMNHLGTVGHVGTGVLQVDKIQLGRSGSDLKEGSGSDLKGVEVI